MDPNDIYRRVIETEKEIDELKKLISPLNFKKENMTLSGMEMNELNDSKSSLNTLNNRLNILYSKSNIEIYINYWLSFSKAFSH